ncbi:MAG TPA: hypothetical protein VLF66_18155 [Thermoanaerobaculia bacterium]|nr:hypothetical protein [Thermoanaerobaculia bacterium]
MAKRGKTIEMSDERFADFLERLASDDQLREAMERDPAATLVGAGFSVRKETMPRKVKLPSKRELKGKVGAYLERMRAGTLDFFPHHLLGPEACGDEEKPPKPKPKPSKGR